MNDEEIKKSLEQHIRIANYVDSDYCDSVSVDLLQKTIDLINQYQAEIKRLQNTIDDVLDREPLLVERAEKYAVEEFAERLRKEVANTWFGVNCTGETDEYKEGCLFGLVAKQKHCLRIIEKLLAERVGGMNEKDS